MHLSHVRMVGLGPFEDLAISLLDPQGTPRKCALVLGSGGVGKTTLLAAIASTRPGSVVQPRLRGRGATSPVVVADWALGDDDPERPHVLSLASPAAYVEGSPLLAPPHQPDDAARSRREQTHFDRKAAERGFVVVAFPAGRFFSRSPVVLGSPTLSILRYDARTALSFDDASRLDLARDTKQVLSYGAIAAALGGGAHLGQAVREGANRVARLGGFSYLGPDPTTLEPMFETEQRSAVAFDELPTGLRHLVSFAVLTARALHAAHPGTDPLACEGVVLLDDVELHQEPGILRAIIPTLRALFPRVQWIVTSASHEVALGCDSSEILALRRMPTTERIELYEGPLAVVH